VTFEGFRGSAFPATLAFQIRELERETGGDLKLDAILTVIDAENFTGYEDTSTTARMQAQYSDVLLIVCLYSTVSSLLYLDLHLLLEQMGTCKDQSYHRPQDLEK
jgi:CobW/HypB/UreG, nucleotide-binding domain